MPLRAADGTPGEAPSVQLNIAPNSNFFSSFIFFEGDANIGWRCGEGGGAAQGMGRRPPGAPRRSAPPAPPPGLGGTARPSPHVAVREGDLHAEQHERLGAVAALPGQQPALSQRGRQALPGAGAPPALAVPALGVAAPRRGSVPGHPAGPASGDGAMGEPRGALRILPPFAPPSGAAAVRGRHSPEGVRQHVAPIEGVDGAPGGRSRLALQEGAPGASQQLALRTWGWR